MANGHGFYYKSLRSDVRPAAVHYEGKGGAAGTVCLSLPGGFWADEPDPDGTVRAIVERDGSAARFDLAADYTGDMVPTVAEVADAILRREWRTRLRSAYEGRDLMTGCRTVYLGAKASDRRIRVYDVRGPVRVEVQGRNDVAARMVESVLQFGSVVAHSAAVRAAVDFPGLRGWSALVAGA